MIIDTHVHLDDARFDEDREELIASLSSHGVGAVINVGSSFESLEKVRELAVTYPQIYAAYGIHPDEIAATGDGSFDSRMFSKVQNALRGSKEPSPVAVGEIGLDYHWMTKPKELQDQWFRAQLDLARQHHLPVIIHSRDAAEDTLRICREENVGAIGGVMHCFSYEKEMAREYRKMGIFLGIGGVVTFKNGRKLKEVVADAPLSQLLLETDCPYLAPDPHRGTRNSPLYLPLIVAAIAKIKGISGEEVIAATAENARQLFGIPKDADQSGAV